MADDTVETIRAKVQAVEREHGVDAWNTFYGYITWGDVLDLLSRIEELQEENERLHEMLKKWSHTAQLDGMYGFWEEAMPELQAYLGRQRVP